MFGCRLFPRFSNENFKFAFFGFLGSEGLIYADLRQYLILSFFETVDTRKPPNRPPRSIPPALNLLPPEVNLLTEFALIATSPQSPLVQEVSGECGDVRRSEEEDSPPPRLMRPKQMVRVFRAAICSPGEGPICEESER